MAVAHGAGPHGGYDTTGPAGVMRADVRNMIMNASRLASGEDRVSGHSYAPWLAVLAGLLLTFGLFWQARQDAYARLRRGFEDDASVRADVLVGAFSNRLGDLELLRRFYDSSEEVDRAEFHAFTQPLLSLHGGLQGLVWIPAVPQAERARLEAGGRQQNPSGFQFTERGPQGRLAVAPARPMYFPGYFVEPLAGNETVLGFDFATDPGCVKAMMEARDSGALVATERLVLPHDPRAERGLLVFGAIYRKGAPLQSAEQRWIALRGFVAGIFHPDDLVRAALEPTATLGLPVDLVDPSAPASARVVVHWDTPSPVAAGPQPSAASLRNNFHWPRDFRFAGRAWRVEVHAGPSYRLARRSNTYWQVLALGLLFTGLLGFYLRMLVSRHARTERLIRERTAALGEREGTLAAITSSARDAIVMVDPEGRISFWNPAAERTFGWSRAEAQGRRLADLLAAPAHPGGLERVFARSASPTGVPSGGETVELSVLRKDGREVPLELSLASVLLHGRAHTVGILRDVAERRQTQARLAKAELQYQELVNNLSVGVYRNIPDDGRFLEANPALIAMFEAGSKEELLRHNATEIYPDSARRQEFVAKVLRLGSVAGEELQLRTLRGRLFWASVSATVQKDEDGRICFDGIIEDITVRRQTEETLQRERILLRTLIDNLPDAIFVKDSSGRKVLANAADVRNTGRQSETEVLGKTDFELFPQDVAAQFWADDQAVIQSGQPVLNREEYFFDAQGERRWLLTSKLPLRDERGQTTGLIGIGHDITLRKRAEETAQHERLLLRTLIDNLPDAIYVKDLQGRKTLANPADRRNMGRLTETEVLGKTDFELFPQDVAARFWADDQAVIQSGQPVLNREEYFFDAQGGQRWLLTSKLPLRDEQGRPLGLIGIGHDITLRKQAEETAQRERILLRTLIDNLPDAVYVKDRGCRKTVANRADVRNIGLPSEADVLGKTDFELFPQEVAARFYADDQSVIQTGQPVINREEYYFDAKGEQRWLQTSKLPLRDERNEIIGLVGVGHDITQRKRAEEKLRLLSRAIEQCPASIVITDPQGCIEYVNPKFTEVTGYTFEEIRGKTPRLLKGGLTPAEEYASLWETLAAGREWQGVFCNRRKDGTLFWEAASISPVTDAVGRTTHFVAVKEDITGLKRASEELRQAKEVAEAASRAKSEFLANMSHEIRTPMNGVIGMTGLLLDTDLTAEQREFAETIRTSGETLLTLINDVLDFSKIEAGHLELEMLDFDLREVVEDTAEILALRAQQKRLEFVCLIEPQVPSLLQGDPGRLRQILVNLAGNAIKFTPQGEVSIHVRLEAQTDTLTTLLFEITDTGIGIPADKRDRLFSAFSQVDASTTRRFGGTGLGLSISKRLVEIMGGSIGVESQENRGSKFWFKIVLAQPTADARLAWKPTADLAGKRVLVVDDNATNRRLVTLLLTSWGCPFEEAADGPAALELLRQRAGTPRFFDVALLDMHMPDMDGEELGRRLKADPALAGLPLIMLTSLCERGEAARLKAAGFASYLTKPLRQTHLYQCLCAVLGHTSPNLPAGLPPDAAERTLAEAHRRKFRILLAEDNITNQRLALALLEKLGYRADAVANGHEALHSLSLIPYDLVLMDCQMPEMDGYEAATLIRDPQSNVLSHTLPVIALTACALQGDRERCLQAGMTDYISKPMRPRELAEVLERWLGSGAPPTLEAAAPLAAVSPVAGIAPSAGSAEPAASPVPSAPKTFDESLLQESLMGDLELTRSICQSFVQEATRQISALQEACERADAPAIARYAHSLKGSSANLGAPALQETAGLMEQQAREEQALQAAVHLPELLERFAALKAALHRFAPPEAQPEQ